MLLTNFSGTAILTNLAGAIALLLWGNHMMSSSLQRGFGTQLRRFMGRHLSNRWKAIASGVVITCILQSSTSVSLMATSFTAAGTLSLAPALAVMLGANIGSTLVVQIMSFNTTLAIPLIILFGFTVFKIRDDSSFESAGSAMIGLGLMLLALKLLNATLSHFVSTPVFHAVINGISGDTLIAILTSILLTLICHSSIAVILLISSFAATGMINQETIMLLVLGANIGGAIPALLGAENSAARRLPIGNLLVRVTGSMVALPLLPSVNHLETVVGLTPAQQTISFHIFFNVLTAIGFIGIISPLARVLEKFLPAHERVGDPGMPIYLEEVGLKVPYIGLSNSVRESLRMADMITFMLVKLSMLFKQFEGGAADDIRKVDQSLDVLSAAIRAYLADIGKDGLSDSDAERAQDILMFVINFEHAGDIISNNLAELATRRSRRGEVFNEYELNHICLLHSEMLSSIRLAVSTFMHEDVIAARQLIERKQSIRHLEASASREHFKTLREDKSTWAESGDIFQRVLRDYRRVHHHLAAIAYPVTERCDGKEIIPDQMMSDE